jgi:1,4-alpha-glucan branching enzyme
VTTSLDDIQALLQARHTSPHSVLGMHLQTQGKVTAVVVRAFLRDVIECRVVDQDAKSASKKAYEMTRLNPEGLFELRLPRRKALFRYTLKATYASGVVREFSDPYCFLPTLSDQDLYLFNEGNEHRIYQKLGAHRRNLGGVEGVAFSVWAPSAERVSVIGNFNSWDGRYHPMRSLGASGVWELFIPELKDGEFYKFEIRDKHSAIHIKTDPYATRFEAPPGNASIVCTTQFTWNDHEWIEGRSRKAGNLDQPISIYELHLGSWKRKPEEGDRVLTYRELAHEVGHYVKELGFTHVEVMPLSEHPFDGSWGYQVTGFFAPTQRFGTPEDFAYFVDHLHRLGIGVILDWVPAHFPRDQFALAQFDGTHLYEHADPRQGAHMDWGTLIFNYGRNEVRAFLIASALAWIDRYHIDGLRVDAVASMLYLDYSRKEGQWIPNGFGGRENLEAIDFLRRTNDLVHGYYPGVTMIAEESTSFPQVSRPTSEGGLGFDYKWNMGWMHDTLRYFSKESVHRCHHHSDLTFGMLYQFAENFVTVFSHDEVVHGKGSMLMKMGQAHIREKAADLRALYTHMWCYPGKKLIFMGSEFGQSQEWNYTRSLDWHLTQYKDHDGIRLLIKDLNQLYRTEPVLSLNDFNAHGFKWISCTDSAANTVGYLRSDPFGSTLFLVVAHLGGASRHGYRIGVPKKGAWTEVINSNSAFYGGSGEGNGGACWSEDIPYDGLEQSISLSLPPLTTLVFKWKSS